MPGHKEVIIQLLMEEHSKAQALTVANYIGNDENKFAALMEIFFDKEYRPAQRAAWPLSVISEKYPDMIFPYLEPMIRKLEPQEHDAVKRNILRFLQHEEIPEQLQGEAADKCFALLYSAKEPVAVKVFAMTVLYNLTRNYPELKNELKITIEEQLPYATPGFKSRGTKILKALNR